MADVQEPGFKIADEFFPFATSVEFGDTILIRRLTGMTMSQYAEAEGEAQLIGLVAMAVRHRYPKWSLDRVQEYVEHIDFERFETVGPDVEEEDDDGPPAVDAAEDAAEPSATSLPESTNGAPAPGSESMHRSVSGIPA